MKSSLFKYLLVGMYLKFALGVYVFNQLAVSSHCVLGTELSAGDAAMDKADKLPAVMGQEGNPINKHLDALNSPLLIGGRDLNSQSLM